MSLNLFKTQWLVFGLDVFQRKISKQIRISTKKEYFLTYIATMERVIDRAVRSQYRPNLDII